MSTRTRLTTSLLLIAMLPACFGGTGDPPDGHDAASGGNDGSAGGTGGNANAGGASNAGGMSATGGAPQTGGAAGTAPPVADGYKLDVLFIVGKTRSMGITQRRLAAAAPTFLAELRRRNLTDVRIAVGSGNMGLDGRSIIWTGPACDSSIGDSGRLPTAAACLQGAEFLHLTGDTVNVPGDPAQLLSCLLQVGTTGCIFTQPLKALHHIWMADRTTSIMRNFFRPEAELLVIIVSDEDDCSTGGREEDEFFKPVSDQFLRLRCATFGHMCDLMRLEAGEQSFPLSSCSDHPDSTTLITIREFPDATREAPARELPQPWFAYLAAMVEQRAAALDCALPKWVNDVGPVPEPYFASPLSSLRLHLLTNAPPPFRRRNLFVDATVGHRL